MGPEEDSISTLKTEVHVASSFKHTNQIVVGGIGNSAKS